MISSRIQAGDVLQVADFAVADGKTKSFVRLLEATTDAAKVLIVAGQFDDKTYLAARNHGGAQLVTASDVHPLAGPFLLENLRLNALAPMRYCHGDWGDGGGAAQAPRVGGRFELIIGSDVLYERDDGGLLPRFIQRHAAAVGEVLIVDPGRGNRGAFNRRMGLMGYALDEIRLPALGPAVGAARLLRYRRG